MQLPEKLDEETLVLFGLQVLHVDRDGVPEDCRELVRVTPNKFLWLQRRTFRAHACDDGPFEVDHDRGPILPRLLRCATTVCSSFTAAISGSGVAIGVAIGVPHLLIAQRGILNECVLSIHNILNAI